MSAQHHFAPGEHRDRDLYARERVLNSAIIAADIGQGWEEYLEIFDDSRVVYERYYDHQQNGGPLTGDDLSLNQSVATLGYGNPS